MLPPSLSDSERAAELKKKDLRRRLRSCAVRIDRIESMLDLGRVDAALTLSWTLTGEFFDLACLLYGKNSRLLSGIIEEPWKATEAPSLLPEGEIREKLNELLHELHAAKADTAEDCVSRAAKCVSIELEILKRAKRVFAQMRASVLLTPLDRYKQLLVRAALAVFALGIVPGAIGYAIYRMSLPRITVREASFGENCLNKSGLAVNGASAGRGNVTRAAALICNGASAGCEVPITADNFGDPAPFCGKDFRITWNCSGDAVLHAATIPAEATGRTVSLRCNSGPRVEVLEATYGGNCRGKLAPGGVGFAVTQGNMTKPLVDRCNFADGPCSTIVELGQMPDPAPQCSKDFEVLWKCSGDKTQRKSRIKPEALGKALTLSCR